MVERGGVQFLRLGEMMVEEGEMVEERGDGRGKLCHY
jgi:hypothetical protein